MYRELEKLSRDVGRTILGHQSLVKQAKQSALVAKESLAACQRLARGKIPSLLGKAVFGDNPTFIHHCLMEMADLLSLSLSFFLSDDIECAPPRDPRTRYRFFGYLAAYLMCIYGHRRGVLTSLRVREVKEALGDDQAGYLINVSLTGME